MFELSYGIQSVPTGAKMNERCAVRAVILEGQQLLMVHNKCGDYKFPGGGVHNGEALDLALRREIAEETGYIHLEPVQLLGKVIQQHPDQNHPHEYFRMISLYYECTLLDRENCGQQLDAYEVDLELRPIFVPIADAIAQNQQLLASGQVLNWVQRETDVLQLIQKKYGLS